MITHKEFLLRQPSFPDATTTDQYYVDLANKIVDATGKMTFVSDMPAGLHDRIALTLTDYMQDIVSDAGLWRSFVDANRELYGYSVPFHITTEKYVDYELNREDVRFLVWYVVAMLWEEKRTIYPHNRELLEFADSCHDILELVYDDAPMPEHFNISYGLEFNDPQDHKAIVKLGNWLFLHSYLLTPAYSLSLRDIMSDIDPNDPDMIKKINDRLDQAMYDDTTGPLAMFTPEWVYLMLERHLPKKMERVEEQTVHPYYEAFVKATDGETLKFFNSYEQMNRFFIEALGWKDGEEHLPQAKGAHDYILMVSKYRGMLMARNVARCIKAPQNPLYDEEYARKHAFEMLCNRGVCPADLLRRCLSEDWLPDAVFPGTNDTEIVKNNADFLSRCYLQMYYRD